MGLLNDVYPIFFYLKLRKSATGRAFDGVVTPSAHSMLSGGLAMKSSKVKFFCAAVAVTIVIYSLLVNLLVTIMTDRPWRSHFYRHCRNYTVTPSGRATQADLLLIATAFNVSVVGLTGISGDRLMQINQLLKANAIGRFRQCLPLFKNMKKRSLPTKIF